MVDFWKREYKRGTEFRGKIRKYSKLFIYNKGVKIGTYCGFLVFLLALAATSTVIKKIEVSEPIYCSKEGMCESFFNITLYAHSHFCMGGTFKGVFFDYPDKLTDMGLYKADMRYRHDNILRWKPYNFTAKKCLTNTKDIDRTFEFKINATKLNPQDTITQGIGDDLIEWRGIGSSMFDVEYVDVLVPRVMFITKEEGIIITVNDSSVRINKTEKSLQINGQVRKLPNSTNGTRYLGFSANGSYMTGASYLKYGNTILNPSDLTYKANKTFGSHYVEDIYYKTFNLNGGFKKNFELKIYYNSRPDDMYIYFGSGSASINIRFDSTSTAIIKINYNSTHYYFEDEMSTATLSPTTGDVVDEIPRNSDGDLMNGNQEFQGGPEGEYVDGSIQAFNWKTPWGIQWKWSVGGEVNHYNRTYFAEFSTYGNLVEAGSSYGALVWIQREGKAGNNRICYYYGGTGGSEPNIHCHEGSQASARGYGQWVDTCTGVGANSADSIRNSVFFRWASDGLTECVVHNNNDDPDGLATAQYQETNGDINLKFGMDATANYSLDQPFDQYYVWLATKSETDAQDRCWDALTRLEGISVPNVTATNHTIVSFDTGGGWNASNILTYFWFDNEVAKFSITQGGVAGFVYFISNNNLTDDNTVYLSNSTVSYTDALSHIMVNATNVTGSDWRCETSNEACDSVVLGVDYNETWITQSAGYGAQVLKQHWMEASETQYFVISSEYISPPVAPTCDSCGLTNTSIINVGDPIKPNISVTDGNQLSDIDGVGCCCWNGKVNNCFTNDTEVFDWSNETAGFGDFNSTGLQINDVDTYQCQCSVTEDDFATNITCATNITVTANEEPTIDIMNFTYGGDTLNTSFNHNKSLLRFFVNVTDENGFKTLKWVNLTIQNETATVIDNYNLTADWDQWLWNYTTDLENVTINGTGQVNVTISAGDGLNVTWGTQNFTLENTAPTFDVMNFTKNGEIFSTSFNHNKTALRFFANVDDDDGFSDIKSLYLRIQNESGNVIQDYNLTADRVNGYWNYTFDLLNVTELLPTGAGEINVTINFTDGFSTTVWATQNFTIENNAPSMLSANWTDTNWDRISTLEAGSNFYLSATIIDPDGDNMSFVTFWVHNSTTDVLTAVNGTYVGPGIYNHTTLFKVETVDENNITSFGLTNYSEPFGLSYNITSTHTSPPYFSANVTYLDSSLIHNGYNLTHFNDTNPNNLTSPNFHANTTVTETFSNISVILLHINTTTGWKNYTMYDNTVETNVTTKSVGVNITFGNFSDIGTNCTFEWIVNDSYGNYNVSSRVNFTTVNMTLNVSYPDSYTSSTIYFNVTSDNGTMQPDFQNQTSSMFNFTEVGTTKMQSFLLVNASIPSCMRLYASTNYTWEYQTDAELLDNTYVNVSSGLSIGETERIWLFANLTSCSQANSFTLSTLWIYLKEDLT